MFVSVAAPWRRVSSFATLELVDVEWGNIAAIVGAGLGSTGLAGLLTGGLQLTKRGRLRKSIERSQQVRALLPDIAPAAAAVQQAIEADAMRLAALTLVGFPKSTTRLLRFSYVYVVVLTGFALAVEATAASDGAPARDPLVLDYVAIIEFLIAIAAFILAITATLAAMLRQRRDAFVAMVQSGISIDGALRRVGDRGPAAQTLRYLDVTLLGGPPQMQPIGWVRSFLEPLRMIRLHRIRARARSRRARMLD